MEDVDFAGEDVVYFIKNRMYRTYFGGPIPFKQLHRENGPALLFATGERAWYQNGKLHREDGPAVITEHGTLQYFLFGKRYPKQKYDLIVQSYLFRVARYFNLIKLIFVEGLDILI